MANVESLALQNVCTFIVRAVSLNFYYVVIVRESSTVPMYQSSSIQNVD